MNCIFQMAFTIVFIQELVQGKGVVVGLQEGDPVNQAVLGAFVVTTLGLTAWLAIKGKDDYTKEEV
jgi:positive regulator of sigma E activity